MIEERKQLNEIAAEIRQLSSKDRELAVLLATHYREDIDADHDAALLAMRLVLAEIALQDAST